MQRSICFLNLLHEPIIIQQSNHHNPIVIFLSHPHLVFFPFFLLIKMCSTSMMLTTWRVRLTTIRRRNEIEEFNDKLYQPSVANIKKFSQSFCPSSAAASFFLVIKFFLFFQPKESLRSSSNERRSRIECQKDSTQSKLN